MMDFVRDLFASACCLAGLAAAAAEPIVVNGGFDDVKDGETVGWKSPGPTYSFKDRVGRNGTRAMEFSTDNPDAHFIPEQALRARTGLCYRYEVWVKTENLVGEGKGATVCMEWFDADGKWIYGSYRAKGVKGTSDGWVKLEDVTGRIPEKAARIVVRPLVDKGMVGRAWFDDVLVRPYSDSPIAGVWSDAYRDRAASGEVTFKAGLNPDASGAGGRTAEFSYDAADGSRKTVRVVPQTEGEAALTLAVADLRTGTGEVTCRVKDASGKVIGTAGRAFTRLAAEPRAKVSFDRLGRTLVDGKPFFPLGLYWADLNYTEHLAKLKDTPFNCVMPYAVPTAQGLDRCQRQGLKVIYPVHTIFHGKEWAPAGVTDDATEAQALADKVKAYASHPALLAWYLADEQPLAMIPRLAKHREILSGLDPDHPCWVVLYQYGQLREYMDAFDVVGTDPYPVCERSAGTVADWMRTGRRETLGVKPFWQVTQIFNWGAYRKTPADKGKWRAPTKAEVRSMAWQGIAGGANGLVFYSFFDLCKAGLEPFEQRWREVREVAEEIKRAEPVILSDAGPAVVSASPSLIVRTWRRGAEEHLLAVNTSEEQLTGSVRLEDGREISLTLAPLAPKFRRLSAGKGGK